MFVGQYTNLDIVATAVMLTLLIVAAFFDANGSEVQDMLTVPFAYMGITISVLHKRWWTALVALLAVIAVLSSWCPKWLKWLNGKLMAKTYKSEEAIQEEQRQLKAKGDRYSQRNGRLMTSVLGMVVAFFLFGSVVGVLSLTETGARVRFICAVALCSGSLYLLKRQTDLAAKDGKLIEAEPLSAFGGADIIVFAGLLGFYGAISFVYVMAATMVGVFIMVLIVKLVKGKKGTASVPLLPGILVMAPVRLYILVTYCPRVLQTFSWASENIETWMH